MKPVMIGLVGRGLNEEGQFVSSARVGKDEVARIIARKYGYRISPFALGIKQTSQILFGLPDEIIWDDSKKFTVLEHWGITPRQMYQRLGTEGGRHVFSDSLWVDMVMKVWEDVKNGKPYTFNLVTEKPVFDDAPAGEQDYEFIVQRAAQVLFQVSDTEVAFSKVHDTPVCWLGLTFEQIVQKLKNETLPAIFQTSADEAWSMFKTVRGHFPTALTASMGPYGMPPRIANGLVINDVRFINEQNAVRQHGGYIGFIERVLPPTVEKVTNHASETELPILPGDTVLKNDSTMRVLEERTDAFVQSKLEEAPSCVS